jgi:hypothetical protein
LEQTLTAVAVRVAMVFDPIRSNSRSEIHAGES